MTPRGWMYVGLGLLAAFVVGYGATALSFAQGTGVDIATVPDARNQTLARVQRLFERADLEFVVADSFPNPSVPAGAILAQSPLPGQEVSPGSVVELFLSTGPRRPAVPDVEGMPLALATRALQTAGFDVTVEEDSGSVPAGRAKLTDPAAGSAVALPATVRLVISTGPSVVEMPAVVGLAEREATRVLEDAGLVVDQRVYDRRFGGSSGDVVDQQPVAGDSVKPGTRVRIVVAPAGLDPAFGDPPGDPNGDRTEDRFDRRDRFDDTPAAPNDEPSADDEPDNEDRPRFRDFGRQ